MARKSRKNLETSLPQMPNKTTFNAGGYIRLSVFDKKQKGDSIETQRAIINAYIAEHSDIELCDIYIDNGLSGQTFERPSFQRMISDIESGKINCCIAKDLSRLGRNSIDTGYYIEKYFPTKGVRFIAITDNIDTSDGQSSGIMISLKNMINEAYALDIGRKIRATVQTNIKNGCFVGGFAPYGYLKKPDDCHKIVPDEYSSNVVRRMFEMANGGQSPKEILAWLNDKNNKILSPSHYLASIGQVTSKQVGAYTHWNLTAVRRILSNRVYCGDMVQGKQRTSGNFSRKLPESEWTVTENTHEAIISREIFITVQKTFGKASKLKEPFYKNPITENIFHRKIFCGICGFAMMRKRGSEHFYRFKCNVSYRYSEDICTGSNITESLLKQTLVDMLHERKLFLDQTVESVQSGNSYDIELASIKTDIDKNKGFLKGLYESLVLGDISDSEYKDMKRSYELKISSLTEQEKELRKSNFEQSQQENIVMQAHKGVKAITQISNMTKEIIDKLVEKIHVYPNGRIGVKFRFMDEVLYNREESV